MRYPSLVALSVALAAVACSEPPQAPPPGTPVVQPVVVTDAYTGCEGGGYETVTRWEPKGAWLVADARRLPAGIVERLRELAQSAPDAATAPLPAELGIDAEAFEEHEWTITETVTDSEPWVSDLEEPQPAVTLEAVVAAARERLIDPNLDTSYASLRIELPGDPWLVIETESEAPFKQPWVVYGPGETKRTVLSLEMSRLAALLVEPASPAQPTLEGAAYWQFGFWSDAEVWDLAFGRAWTAQRAAEWCKEVPGWEDVAETWRLEGADIGHYYPQGSSLMATLVAKDDALISYVRWSNRLDDDDETLSDEWDAFAAVYERASKAAVRLPCLAEWKRAGPGRTVTLDAVGTTGYTESDPETFYFPVWEHSGLSGSPGFELILRIDERAEAWLLLGGEADGAVVLTGHATLTGDATTRYHPTTGTYALLRPDGTTEPRTMPPVR